VPSEAGFSGTGDKWETSDLQAWQWASDGNVEELHGDPLSHRFGNTHRRRLLG